MAGIDLGDGSCKEKVSKKRPNTMEQGNHSSAPFLK